MNWLVPIDIGLIMGLIFAWAVLALSLAFRLLNFPDLTVEGSLPIGAATFAVLLKEGIPLPIAMLAGVIAGGLTGAVTGIIYVRFKLNKFLAGIIVVAMAYSVSLRIMAAPNIGLLEYPSAFDSFDRLNKSIGGPYQIGIVLGLGALLLVGFLILVWVLSSRPGVRIRAAGSNGEYARSIGINVAASMILGLCVTNALAAFSGILLASYQGFADIGMGQGVLILALAAMTIGEHVVPKRKVAFYVAVIIAAIAGSVLYEILVSLSLRIGLAPTDLKLVTAILVLIVVALRISEDGQLFEEGSL